MVVGVELEENRCLIRLSPKVNLKLYCSSLRMNDTDICFTYVGRVLRQHGHARVAKRYISRPNSQRSILSGENVVKYMYN